MVEVLERILIKDRDNVEDTKVRGAYGMLCGFVGIGLNVVLFIAKLFAGYFSGSVAIIADACNNLSDAGSSVITLLGFKMAQEEADPDHPFGHGRIEYVSGLVVSLIILLVAFELFKTSIDKIIHIEKLMFSKTMFIILLLSIVVKFYMYLYNRRIGKKIKSEAMLATATDSLSDCGATAVVLFGMVFGYITGKAIDGYLGIIVSVIIFIAGIKAAKETINPLLGSLPDAELVKRIEELVLGYDLVIGIHDLIVHNYGPGRLIISLHAEVPSDGDLLQMHDTIDLIEHRLQSELKCQAVIHMDPICVHDEKTNELKAVVSDIVTKISDELSIHDFRIVEGPTHTNLIFDVVSPYQFRLGDDELIKEIAGKVSAYNENYFVVIEVDKKFA